MKPNLVFYAPSIREDGSCGIWKMEDTASVTAKLIPMMENLPQVGAIKFGETSGRSYLLTRSENIWMTRTTFPDKPGEIRWQQWVNGQPMEIRVEKKAFNFKERLWYRVGLSHSPQNQAAVTWMPPYLFDYDKIPGLSWPSAKAADITVMALDVPINGLFNRI